MTDRESTIEKVKLSRRIKHDKLDAEISDLVDACMQDLRVTVGVLQGESDPLILTAIKLYCAAWLTQEPKDCEFFQAKYERLKSALQISSSYGGGNQYD